MRDRSYVEQLVANGKHFCMVPWVHLHVTGLGNMAPCMCLAEGPDAEGYGSLNVNSFSELWQGEKIRRFRLRLLEDKGSFNCKKCYQREKIGDWSQRKDVNEKYGHHVEWVLNTDESGFAHDAKPIYWDIRFSNLCNLKCRMCTYSASSSWVEDAKKLGFLRHDITDGVIKGVKDTDRLLRDIDQYIPYLEKVHFAGGEPLLLRENLHILERLIHYKNFTTEIKYNTNLTTLGNNAYVLEQWKQFTNIHSYVSIDGIGKKCEYVRKNLHWDSMVQHIEQIKEATDVDLIVNTTVSIFNIMDLPEIHWYLVEQGYFQADKICLNLLHTPEYYNIKILPQEMKAQVITKIREHIAWMKGLEAFKDHQTNTHQREQIGQWETCIAHMTDDEWTHLIPKFIENTAKLDELRGEKLLDVFPELEPLLSLKGRNENYD